MSLGKPRPVLPKEWTYRVFQAIHSLAHAGPRLTQRAIADAMYGTASNVTLTDGAENARVAKQPKSIATSESHFLTDPNQQGVFTASM